MYKVLEYTNSNTLNHECSSLINFRPRTTHLFTDMIILFGYSLMDTCICSHMHVHSLIQTNILQPPFTNMKCS